MPQLKLIIQRLGTRFCSFRLKKSLLFLQKNTIYVGDNISNFSSRRKVNPANLITQLTFLLRT